MAQRQEAFIDDEIYHVYNRGVEKRKIFIESMEFNHFLECIYFYQQKNPPTKFSQRKFTPPECKKKKIDENDLLVEIVAYCLMPNHYHLILKQKLENGISKFVGRFSNSYTKYFNTKYSRVGHLFQGQFKAKRIINDEQLLHLSRYIHLNPFVSKIIADPAKYIWSSLSDYLNKSKGSRINAKYILSHFSSNPDYKKFIYDYSDYALSLEIIKHEIID